MSHIRTFIDNIESYVCRTLLATFVGLLFTQIVARQLFEHSISWIEELSVIMFVWFAFFGASYAAKLNAHNRVTFHLKMLPGNGAQYVQAFADLFWIAFNLYFVYLSLEFIFKRMNKFWKAQTLGIEMKYFYLILPIAFTLMAIRIAQVHYRQLVKGVKITDPDSIDIAELKAQSPASVRSAA